MPAAAALTCSARGSSPSASHWSMCGDTSCSTNRRTLSATAAWLSS